MFRISASKLVPVGALPKLPAACNVFDGNGWAWVRLGFPLAPTKNFHPTPPNERSPVLFAPPPPCAQSQRSDTILGVDSPLIQPSFFSKLVISPGFGGFLERRIPEKNGEATPRTMLPRSDEPIRGEARSFRAPLAHHPDKAPEGRREH